MFALGLGSVLVFGQMAGWWGRSVPASAWETFVPPEGRCQLLMPGTPKAEVVSVDRAGLKNAQRYEVIRKDEGAVFLLIIADRDAKETSRKSFPELYVPVREYILAIQDGEVIWEDDIMMGPHAGKELQVRPAEGGLLLARVYLVRGRPFDRLYILVTAGAWLQPGKGDAAKFFESFKLESEPVNRPRDKKPRIRTAFHLGGWPAAVAVGAEPSLFSPSLLLTPGS
jgi:hypothetical protein